MKALLLSRLSFRAKISLYGAAVGFISLGLVATLFVVNEELSFRSSFSSLAFTEADIVRTSCASAVVFHDPDFATRSLAGLAGSTDVAAAAVYLGDRTVLATYFRDGAEESLPEILPTEEQVFSGVQLTTTLPIRFGDDQVGWISMRSELPGYGPRLRRHMLIATAAMFLSLLISLWIASFLQNPITGPVRELQAAAQSMAAGTDPGVRARKLADDELGELTDSFNEMFGRVMARENDLRESKEQFAGLLDRLGEAVFRMRVPARSFEYCSPAARNVFGYAASEFLIRPGLLEEIVHPDDREFMAVEMDKVESGRPAPVWEYRTVDRNGGVRWIYQTNSVLEDDQGQVTALEACCTDITARHEAVEEKRRLEAELAQAHKLEALGNLAGGIAHDFNNLLGAIIGNTGLTADELPADHPTQDYLNQISRATNRATALTQQILSFSRRSDRSKDPVDLGRLTTEAVGLISTTLPASLRVETRVSKERCVVLADPNELHRVVMNLCTNAGHAIESGAGVLTVAMTPVQLKAGDPRLGSELEPGPYAEWSYADTGHGISEENLGRIFEPFFTTKPAGQGTGMGLSVVYGIIKDLGGTIEVESRSGTGATFRILLPLTTEEIRQPEPATPRPRVTSGRVLFVDDEEALTLLAQRALTAKGFTVDGFTDPLLAVEAFRDCPESFDVVVTDLAMPRMNGIELAKKILTLRPEVPVVLCSGFMEEMTRQSAEAIGIHGIVAKPLELTQIDRLVQAALTGRPLPDGFRG